MRDMRIALIATVAACLAAAAPILAGPTSAVDGQLTGSVGPGFVITVREDAGFTRNDLTFLKSLRISLTDDAEDASTDIPNNSPDTPEA